MNDYFGWALAACNLNGDPYDDLVVGVPGEAVTVSATTFSDAGRIAVFYGSPSGLPAIPSATFIERHYPGELNLPAADANFGFSLACGNFDGNAFVDLAVGAPNRNLPTGAVDAGRVNIFPGSAAGIGAGAFPLDQDANGIADDGENGDGFGYALAAGDFDGNGSDDLAVGVHNEDDANGIQSGAVHLLYGDSQGAATGGNLLYFESSFGGTNVDSYGFGFSLAAGDFDADGIDDFASGVPGKEIGGIQIAGLFFESHGTVLGLDEAGATDFSQGFLYGPSENETPDQFGCSLAAADFDGDGADDLAVGHRGENVLQSFDGAVTVIMGQQGTGLDPLPNRLRKLEHGFGGIPGSNIEGGLAFGQTLAAGDFDGDGYADLAIGAPFEEEDNFSSVGTVTVLYGSLFADGFDGALTNFWSDTAP